MGATVGLLTGLAAQSRSPCFATVVDAHGERTPGALVTCVFTPQPAAAGEVDVVTATTDELGRARVDLVDGRVYAAWAVRIDAGDGSATVSLPNLFAGVGSVFELVVEFPCAPRTLEVAGAEAWREYGARSLQWRPVAGQAVWHRLSELRDGPVVLPAGPPTDGFLALADAGGRPLAIRPVPTEPGLQDSGAMKFSTPWPLEFHVTDEKGAAIAGARVEFGIGRGPLVRLFDDGSFADFSGAVTDERGRADVLLEYRGHMEIAVRASRIGFCSQAHSVRRGLRFVLSEQAAAELRVVGCERSEALELLAVEFGRTGPDPIPLRPVRTATASWLVPAAGGSLVPRFAVGGVVPEILVGPSFDGGEVVEIDAGDLSTFDLQIFGAGGNPAAAAVALVAFANGSVTWENVVASDKLGRARIRGFEPARALFVTTGREAAIVALDDVEDGELPIRLAPMERFEVHAVAADGSPVANARLIVHETARARPGNVSRDRLRVEIARRVVDGLARVARSDSGGVLRLFLPAAVEVRVSVAAGKLGSEPLTVRSGTAARVVLAPQ
ncbi:MAG: hypothetical protein KDE27_26455 [Planctomycetes bacterium]|nr:hypothetical protein [Planctomycetota bacterium]